MNNWSVVAFVLIAVFGLPDNAAAKKKEPCVVLCSPRLTLIPTMELIRPIDETDVRLLPSGTEDTLSTKTQFSQYIVLNIPTEWKPLALVFQAVWSPFVNTKANNFTGYTATELGVDAVDANLPVLEFGPQFTIIPAKLTNDWLVWQASIIDELSPAQQPEDKRNYTHKLTFQTATLLGVFAWLPKHTYMHHVHGYLSAEYVATGLPNEGDEVPDGQMVYLEDANPIHLYFGLSFPIAPLNP